MATTVYWCWRLGSLFSLGLVFATLSYQKIWLRPFQQKNWYWGLSTTEPVGNAKQWWHKRGCIAISMVRSRVFCNLHGPVEDPSFQLFHRLSKVQIRSRNLETALGAKLLTWADGNEHFDMKGGDDDWLGGPWPCATCAVFFGYHL